MAHNSNLPLSYYLLIIIILYYNIFGVISLLFLFSASHLLKPPVAQKRKISSYIPRRLRWEYIKKNPTKVIFVTLYFLLNAALCIWVGYERRTEGGWVILARINGMCLNFNSMFILVLMMKGLLTWVRSTRYGKFFPIDQHIIFHISVAVVIFFQSLLHFIGHLGRYRECRSIFWDDCIKGV
jgi:magnesium-transporting ATPase (P-type)